MNIFSPNEIIESAQINDNFALLQQTVKVEAASLTNALFTSTGAYEDTGWDLTLPAQGTWLILSSIRVQVVASAASVYVRIALYDETASLNVPNTNRIAAYCTATGTHIETITYAVEYETTAANTVIAVRGKRSSSSFSSTGVYSDANGESYLYAVRRA